MMSICACLKEPYCALLNSAAVWIDETVEKHMLESKLELKEVKISISCFLFFVCFTSRSPPCLQHNPCFVSGQGFSGWEYWVRDCVHTHTHMNDIRVFVCLAAFVYMSTECIVGAGALLSQPITFTSTPNLSWVSRVRVKAEEVATIKWLLPHHKWEKSRGNGSRKVAAVLYRGQSKDGENGKKRSNK